jgi:hypothetical protein
VAHFVILNEVKDLKLLKIRDSSLRSECPCLSLGNFAKGSRDHPEKYSFSCGNPLTLL